MRRRALSVRRENGRLYACSREMAGTGCEIVRPHTRPRRVWRMAVRDQQPPASPVHNGVVRDPDAGIAETVEPAGPEVQPEHRCVSEVAGEQRAVTVERQTECEAAGVCHFRDATALWRDAEDLTVLARAPDIAIRPDGDALGMLQSRL